jgi:hypothetical protein
MVENVWDIYLLWNGMMGSGGDGIIFKLIAARGRVEIRLLYKSIMQIL